MSKPFKWFCLFMSVVILVSSVLLISTPNDVIKTVKEMVGSDEVITDIKNYQLNMTTVVYVQNTEGEWEEYQRLHGEENRIWVDMKDIPQKLKDAFISIEDQRFYEHGGVDWKRTMSAFLNYLPFVNIYDSNQGGSTITQQLIKNITDDRARNASRKLREIVRALIVESELSKEKIFEAYLNTISLGNGICGVQVAANYYFNKDVSELSLAECASIAAITKNPSKYNPDKMPKSNEERRKSVLDKMLELGKITNKEYTEAVESEVVVDKSQQSNFEIPVNNYFVDAMIHDVAEDLAEAKGMSTDSATKLLYNGGFRIYATVDSAIQEKMEEVFENTDNFPLKSRKDGKSMQAAMTILDYEGNVKGVIGGVGEKTINRGLNRAIDSPRQPGSTMKPLGVYALAIDRGIVSYSSVVEDEPVPNYYGKGRPGPKEWYGEYEGRISVRRAISHSANTIPVKLIGQIGLEDSYSFLKYDLNLSYLSDVDINPASLAIGGCQYGITTTQSAAAFAIFGSHGVYNNPKTYVKVTDSAGNIVLSRKEGRQVLKPEAADIMNKLLQGVVYDAGGTGGRLAGYSNMRVYAKTGTSSEANDSWIVGGTPYYIGSVWCGFDSPEGMHTTGFSAKAWRAIMSDIHKGLEYREFEMSDKIYTATFCKNTGNRAGASCTDTEVGYCIPGIYYKYCDGVHIYEEEETEGEETKTASSGAAGSSSAASTSSASSADSSGSSSSSGTQSTETSTTATTP